MGFFGQMAEVRSVVNTSLRDFPGDNFLVSLQKDNGNSNAASDVIIHTVLLPYIAIHSIIQPVCCAGNSNMQMMR